MSKHLANARVRMGGIDWTLHSTNERSCTVENRFFFACRCNSKSPWVIIETDMPIQNGSKELRRWRFNDKTTLELSNSIKGIVQVTIP